MLSSFCAKIVLANRPTYSNPSPHDMVNSTTCVSPHYTITHHHPNIGLLKLSKQEIRNENSGAYSIQINVLLRQVYYCITLANNEACLNSFTSLAKFNHSPLIISSLKRWFWNHQIKQHGASGKKWKEQNQRDTSCIYSLPCTMPSSFFFTIRFTLCKAQRLLEVKGYIRRPFLHIGGEDNG